jgi:hypothetical protein
VIFVTRTIRDSALVTRVTCAKFVTLVTFVTHVTCVTRATKNNPKFYPKLATGATKATFVTSVTCVTPVTRAIRDSALVTLRHL